MADPVPDLARAATLPAPTSRRAQDSAGAPYRIALVCLGNICRSPMAEVVLHHRLEESGLADRVELGSAGTGDWHVGEPMDRRAAATLAAAGLDPTAHRARQLAADGPSGFGAADLLLVMDRTNLRDVLDLGAPPERVRLFRAFDPAAGGDLDDLEVPDPWYGGPEGFDEVLAMVERTSRALTRVLDELLR